MTKQYKTRLSRIAFFAALAFTFWLFDLMIFAWIFAALVIIPFVIGFVIMVCNQDVTKRGGAHQPTVDNTTTPPRNPDVTEEPLIIKGPITEDQKRELKAQLKKWYEEGHEIKMDRAAAQELE